MSQFLSATALVSLIGKSTRWHRSRILPHEWSAPLGPDRLRFGIDRGCRAFRGSKPWPDSAGPTASRSSARSSEEFLAGETLHGLAKRHDLCRNLIRVWVAKYEAGGFDEDAKAADLIQAYEARIAALERLVGKQALELEFLRGASASAARARNAPTSVITGPLGSPSLKDAG